jgi:hypothetical protein
VAGDKVVYYNSVWTCSPSGLPRYVVNGDGTLTDNQTGLMWELKTSTCSGEITCVNNSYTFYANSPANGATDGTLYTSFLATLNGGVYYSPSAGQDVSSGIISACFANHCDWRIPTAAELQTIEEKSAPGCGSGSPCIDPAFGPTLAQYYCSSTSPNGATYEALYGDFYGGGIVDDVKYAGATLYARAVRSGR